MSITVFSDVILSNQVITAGIRGRQIRRNSRVTTESGAEAINIIWTQTLREYEIGIAPLMREDWQEIEAIHEVTDGGAYGFLMLDPKDHTVSASGVSTGIVQDETGSPATTFQLYKRYTEPVSSRTKDRKITRLKASTIVIYVSGVALGGGSYTLDPQTGIVTIPAAPAAATVTWTGTFYTPVHFMEDSIDWELVVTGPNPDARYLAGPSVVLQEIRE
jgi:uncharacterized protein (TIGR02217 family)